MANQQLERGLRMVPLDLADTELMALTDRSFANNRDLSLQIGFLTTIVNERFRNDRFEITCNVLH